MTTKLFHITVHFRWHDSGSEHTREYNVLEVDDVAARASALGEMLKENNNVRDYTVRYCETACVAETIVQAPAPSQSKRKGGNR